MGTIARECVRARRAFISRRLSNERLNSDDSEMMGNGDEWTFPSPLHRRVFRQRLDSRDSLSQGAGAQHYRRENICEGENPDRQRGTSLDSPAAALFPRPINYSSTAIASTVKSPTLLESNRQQFHPLCRGCLAFHTCSAKEIAGAFPSKSIRQERRPRWLSSQRPCTVFETTGSVGIAAFCPYSDYVVRNPADLRKMRPNRFQSTCSCSWIFTWLFSIDELNNLQYTFFLIPGFSLITLGVASTISYFCHKTFLMGHESLTQHRQSMSLLVSPRVIFAFFQSPGGVFVPDPAGSPTAPH
jgi:hypothetical protein